MNNSNDTRINDIVEMLDEFTNSEGKRVKIDTSDKLKVGETKKSCYLSKYDKTDPFVHDLAAIAGNEDRKLYKSAQDASLKFDSFSFKK